MQNFDKESTLRVFALSFIWLLLRTFSPLLFRATCYTPWVASVCEFLRQLLVLEFRSFCIFLVFDFPCYTYKTIYNESSRHSHIRYLLHHWFFFFMKIIHILEKHQFHWKALHHLFFSKTNQVIASGQSIIRDEINEITQNRIKWNDSYVNSQQETQRASYRASEYCVSNMRYDKQTADGKHMLWQYLTSAFSTRVS